MQLRVSTAAHFFPKACPLNSHAQERLGYPTQKPVALLERILNA